MNIAATPVAPFSGQPLLVFLLDIAVLLGCAFVLGRLAVRIGLPAIVGELSAGVILGPSILGHVAPGFSDWLLPRDAAAINLVDGVGQIGVLLLVALTGAHLDLHLIRRRAATTAKVSSAGLIVPLALGIGLGLVLPATLHGENADPIVFALFLGVAMCVSAIPVIAKTLVDMRLLHRDIGQLILASSTIDDAFGWLMLAVVSALATTGLAGTDVAVAVGNLVLVVAFACTIGRFLVRRAMRLAYRSGEPVAAVAVPVILILLSAAGTHALRLEPVVGAFLCGIVIGSCRDVDRGWTQPLNAVVLSVLAPIFFATAGLRMDLTALLRPDVALAGLAVVALAIVGKFLGAWIGALISGLTRWEALALGGGMNARGVIEVIIAMAGVRLGLLSTEMYTIIVLVAVVTSVMAPPVLRFAMNRVEQNASEHLRERDLFPTSPGDRTAVGSTATAAD